MSSGDSGKGNGEFDRHQFARRLISETPNMTDRELEAVRKSEFLREAAEQAIADSLESARALHQAYDPEVIADEIQQARRSLTNDQQHIFTLMLRCRTHGEFDDLCDEVVWEPKTNPETIAQQLKRMRTRLNKRRPGKWSFIISQPKNQDQRTFVWTRRADRPGIESCAPN